ncbi:MAG: arylsulfatase [Akkermansiaceae bacterium]|nr:arylsulfatase [Akkermansiaceae bacterium]
MKSLVLALVLSLPVMAFGDPAKPNVVYILADDLGYGDLRSGNPEGGIATPGSDQMAKEGMVFTDAHSNSSVCTPTRYGVLTGRFAFRSRMKKGVLSGYSTYLIEKGRMTVPSFLKGQGYHTAFIGKWHLGWDWAKNGKKVDFSKPVRNGPKEKGFEYSYGHCGSLDMAPYVWVENGMPTAVPTKETGRTKQESKNGWWRNGPTSPDFDHEDVLPNLTRRAVKYVREQTKNEKPFFLYLALPSPHTPVLPTAGFKGKSGLESAYADFVTMTDDTVKQVLDALKEAGVDENTLFIFTSDNGCSPEADFAELERQGHDPSYIYRGHKADIFEGGHRVPFIVRWPAKVKAGTTCDDTTCLTDLLATVAEVLGQKLPADAGEDSVSMLPNLLGGSGQPLREATVHHSINGTFAIRQGKWKLIDAPHSGGWSSPTPAQKALYKDLPKIQLYDLEKDAGETRNVSAENPAIVEKLQALLRKYREGGRSVPASR